MHAFQSVTPEHTHPALDSMLHQLEVSPRNIIILYYIIIYPLLYPRYQIHTNPQLFPGPIPQLKLTLKVLVTTIDAQWEGMGDVGSARYEPALLPPCPTIRVLSYSN